jgi:myo-inositol 2-dehydrogenase/D-chiro-inositol 1-dehydrogenase
MPTPLPIGLIGAGRIGRLHAQHVQTRIPDARLVAVADPYLPAAQEVGQRWGTDQITGDYRELLENPQVAAVLICSATETHAQIIEEAAALGKQIFCEKPIDHDLARIDQALAAVERAGVLFQIGFNRRFDANYARVRRAIGDGEIGEPHLMHIISRDPAPPPISYVKASGGLFMDMTIHDFDMARFLIQDEVTEIYAVGGVRVDPAIGEAGDLDTALITLRFRNGVFATIDNSRKAVYGYDQRVEVFGSGGMVQTGNNYPNTALFSTGAGVAQDLPLNFFMERYVESYVAEIEAFVQAVHGAGAVPVSGGDGRVSVVMAMAALRSYQEGRTVRLDEIG